MTRVIGVEEPKTNTRQHTKLRSVGISSVRTTHKEESSSNSKQIQYGLRDQNLDYNNEIKDMEDSSEREERMDENVCED